MEDWGAEEGEVEGIGGHGLFGLGGGGGASLEGGWCCCGGRLSCCHGRM